MKRAIILIAAAFLAACGAPASPSAKLLEGLGDLKFGMSFLEFVTAVGVGRINPYSLKDCGEDLPLKGCLLSPDSDASPYLSRDGIPYRIGGSVTKFDKLSSIDLLYQKRGSVTSEQCIEVTSRTLDWVAKEFAPLKVANGKDEKDAKVVKRQTAAGLHFETTSTSALNWMASARTEMAEKKSVSFMSFFFVIDGKPECSVNLSLKDDAAPPIVLANPELDQVVQSVSVAPKSPDARLNDYDPEELSFSDYRWCNGDYCPCDVRPADDTDRLACRKLRADPTLEADQAYLQASDEQKTAAVARLRDVAKPESNRTDAIDLKEI